MACRKPSAVAERMELLRIESMGGDPVMARIAGLGE